MKKQILILVFGLFACLNVFAQMEESKVKSSDDPWKFGVNIAASYDYEHPTQHSTGKIGVKAGFAAEKHLVYNIYFKPTVNLCKKGFKEDTQLQTLDYNAYFLEIEANLEMKFGDERTGKGFLISITPFYSYGLFGSTTFDILEGENAGSETIDPFANDDFLRPDLGYKLGIGYDINHNWELNATYLFGFYNIINGSSHKWRGVNVGLTYFF
ncbi:MAG: outer membrane beta-barrel protein [Bacteroidales bacterium]|nr:outer membrane beta-barrel protein [Bacteroidales bacterium]